jgi:hypothetical protein
MRTQAPFVWLVADGWCWFVLREEYCWLVADKPNEQGAGLMGSWPWDAQLQGHVGLSVKQPREALDTDQ